MESTHFDFSAMDFQNMNFGTANGGLMADEQQSFLKPVQGNTNTGFFFGGDEGIETTTSSHFDMGSATQSFDSINTDLFSVPQESFGMSQNLNMDNTIGNASWNSQLSPSLDGFVMPTPAQTFASLYQPQASSSNKRSLQLDTQDFPVSKRQESADFTAFSPFATSNSVAGSSWTMDNIMTPSSSNDIGLTDEAADVCATWFSKYAILPSDRHVESLSQLTGESANAIRHWFGQMLKQGMAGHDSAYKSQTSLSQQEQPHTVPTTSMTFQCNPETHTSTTQPTSTRSKQRCTPTNNMELLERDEKKVYQCTRKCGKRYGRKCDWKRNEEEGYPSKSWMCSLCISLGVENVKPCYRKYHFSQHFRNIHPSLNSDDYEAASVVHSDTSFPRKCGFCAHRFVSRQERIDHLADHFKKGKCMLNWNDDEDENHNGSDNNDEDDDNDNDDQHDFSGSDGNNSSPSDQSGNTDRGGSGPNNGSGGGDHSDRPHSPGGNSQFTFSQFKQNGDVSVAFRDVDNRGFSVLRQGVSTFEESSQRSCFQGPTASCPEIIHPNNQRRISPNTDVHKSCVSGHPSPAGGNASLVAGNALSMNMEHSPKSIEVVMDSASSPAISIQDQNSRNTDFSPQEKEVLDAASPVDLVTDSLLESIVDNLLHMRNLKRLSDRPQSVPSSVGIVNNTLADATTAAALCNKPLLEGTHPPIVSTWISTDSIMEPPPPLLWPASGCEDTKEHSLPVIDYPDLHVRDEQVVLQTTVSLAPASSDKAINVLEQFAFAPTIPPQVDLRSLWSLFRVKTSQGSLTEQDKALAKFFIAMGMPLSLNSAQWNSEFIATFLEQLEKMPHSNPPRLIEPRNNSILSPSKIETVQDLAHGASQTLSALSVLSKLVNERVPSYAWQEIDAPTVKLFQSSQSFVSVKLLGSGGFSTVDEVVHRETSLRVSRKTLKNRKETALEEVQKEVAVLQKLRHPHIVRFLGAYTKGDKVSILLSPVAETTLAGWLQNCSVDKSLHLPATIVKMFGCLLSSVRYLHEQRPVVKHMDIKPQNILVMHGDQEFPHVILSDFGISSTESAEDVPAGEAKPLTRKYCAPEVPGGNSRDPAADIWSLGCVFLEMASAAFGKDDLQWVHFRAEYCDYGSKFYWQDVPRLQEHLTTFLGQAADIREATVFHTVKSMLNGTPTERPDAARLTMIFTPAPCCLDWANDKQSFPGPIEELRNVEMLVHEEGVDCVTQFCACGVKQTTEGSPKDGLTSHQERSTDNDLRSCERASAWLQDCSHNHDACRRPTNHQFLPTRLVDIRPDGLEGSSVRVINSSDIKAEENFNGSIEYAVICHQWNTADVTLSSDHLIGIQNSLEQQEHCQLRQGLDLSRGILSKAVDDALTVASRTGHRFVWIDSLCVVQDSEEEKQRECVTMASVYRNANLTIVASPTESKNNLDGLFTQNEASVPQYHLDWDNPGFSWDTRAWSLQERLLSSRLLHLAGEQMYWECNSLKASETFPHGLPTLVWEKVHTRSSTPVTPSTMSSPRCKPAASLLRDCMFLKKEEDGIDRLLPVIGTRVNDEVLGQKPIRLADLSSSKDDNVFHFDFALKLPKEGLSNVHASHELSIKYAGKETNNQFGSRRVTTMKNSLNQNLKSGSGEVGGRVDVKMDGHGMTEG
ncbi:hypothetical protein P154DRAFT_523864 [Amniculicola lignicola CBS 123094]|uniref:Protein kinase domain-containing protein n=1 Tax=Amniculicola lignicola CBS 123094 TaxID=1392246 RepID=A0A6A5WBT5_9PLEO|nr:hypothetical protein P154DRAFT_523864 [Amniculicola lignicola CBS 123094]